MSKKLIRLSASKIKTYNNCSWLGYAKYNLHLPSKGNTGSKLGSLSHTVLECLASKKREDLVNQAIELNSALAVSSIKKLVIKLLKKENLFDSENLEKIDLFLLTALRNDFWGKGSINSLTEYEFDIQEPNRYWINGFIDRIFEYPDFIRIVDFKTSKSKFTKGSEDDIFNLQALLYSLVAYKLYPNKPVYVDFLFLKFPKNPKVSMSFIKSQIIGFEDYLEHINDYLSDFGIEKAMSDLAADGGYSRSWLCGRETPFEFKRDGSPAFCCEFRNPTIFFIAEKEGEKSIVTFTKKELDKYEKLGYTISQKRYSGCPKFN